MALERSFRAFTRRWWADNRELPVDESIQPVVLVDDVRALALPPLNEQFCSADSTGAVIAEHGTMLLEPISRPLRVIEIRVTATGRVRFGIGQKSLTGAPPPNGGAAANPGLLQAPLEPSQQLDAIQGSGTRAAPLLGEDNMGALATTVLQILNTIVLPGQYFFVQNETANQIMTVNYLRWEQLPDTAAEQMVTSSSKTNAVG